MGALTPNLLFFSYVQVGYIQKQRLAVVAIFKGFSDDPEDSGVVVRTCRTVLLRSDPLDMG